MKNWSLYIGYNDKITISTIKSQFIFTASGKIIEVAHSEAIHISFFYVAVNKLITDKIQILFSIAENSGFIKHFLNKLD